MANYLDESGLNLYDRLIKAYIGDAIDDVESATTEAIAKLASALKFKSVIHADDVTRDISYYTITTPQVGDVYFIGQNNVASAPTRIQYYDGEGVQQTEVFEIGDALVCVETEPENSQANTYPRWGTLQTNWNVIVPQDDADKTLSNTTAKTLATVGGVDIKAKLSRDLSTLAKKIATSAFSTSASYAVGDYVTYSNKLYKCTTAHNNAAWEASHFKEVTGNILALGADGDIVDSGLNSGAWALSKQDIANSSSGTKDFTTPYAVKDYAVAKEAGKGLSTNDFTGGHKTTVEKLMSNGSPIIDGVVTENTEINEYIGDRDTGVENPKHANAIPTVKAIAGVFATSDELRTGYVRKEAGKGLSTNDYTTAEKQKLEGIQAGANTADVEWDATNHKLTKTINGSTTDAATRSQLQKAITGKEGLAVSAAASQGLSDPQKSAARANIGLGDAAVKNVDTSISPTSTNLPTSAAVANSERVMLVESSSFAYTDTDGIDLLVVTNECTITIPTTSSFTITQITVQPGDILVGHTSEDYGNHRWFTYVPMHHEAITNNYINNLFQ